MKLNHLDLQVTDVQESVRFLEHFGLTLETNRTSPAFAILSDGHGFVLVLQRCKDGSPSYPSGFHLGFLVDEVETVQAIHARARAARLEISDLIDGNRGLLTYCKAPDGFLVEVSCRRGS